MAILGDIGDFEENLRLLSATKFFGAVCGISRNTHFLQKTKLYMMVQARKISRRSENFLEHYKSQVFNFEPIEAFIGLNLKIEFCRVAWFEILHIGFPSQIWALV